MERAEEIADFAEMLGVKAMLLEVGDRERER